MSKSLKDIMTPLPVSIQADSSLKDAIRLMRSEKVSHLLVTDANGNLMGIISKQDVMDSLFIIIGRTTGKTYTALELEGLKLSDIMTQKPFCLQEDASPEEASSLIVEKHINCVPIVDSSNNIVGVVTSYDILKDSIK